MPYIIDTNSFIEPFRVYYPFDLAPTFWNILASSIRTRKIIFLKVVETELTKHYSDELAKWVKNLDGIRSIQVNNDQKIVDNYGKIFEYIHSCGLYTERAIMNWSGNGENVADPWIIATALKLSANIITSEKSAAGNLAKNHRANNPKIPDVAKHFGIKCVSIFDFLRAINFKFK